MVPDERLPRQRGGIEGSGQTPQGHSLTDGVKSAQEGVVCRGYTFKSVSFADPLHLQNPEAGGQRSLAAKRTDFAPGGITLDILGQ
jgi:hypothetical protein